MTDKTRVRFFIACMAFAAIAVLSASLLSTLKGKGDSRVPRLTEILADSISRIADEYPGEIGVAVIIGGSDTVAVNDRAVYPMMSVFKLHQALAVCDRLDSRGISLDTLLSVDRKDLDAHTWSPMLKEHSENRIALPVSEFLRYTLTLSDNNASNLMFRRLVDAASTDSYISQLLPRESFRIEFTESEMSADHAKAYRNRTSPLGAAMLVNRLFTDSLVSCGKQDFVKRMLLSCGTGIDRISAPLQDKEGVKVAHKTGSGYRNERGELVAHNDLAFITLPDGTSYSLAVFVKDFKGDEKEASAVIARISEFVYRMVSRR